MKSDKTKIQAVPVNIITGFLGVGKTTAIIHLLKQKPESERWAVLVNEFGEIGVDGSLLEGHGGTQTGIFIREVPGGCMCCAAGLPMAIALNQLLARAKPHRMLIEPTGLGHPMEVLEELSADHYRDVLDIQKNITLIDARKLQDSRYTNHSTFNQQISIADVIIGNKSDLYGESEQALLKTYVAQHNHNHPEVLFAEHGKIDPSVLVGQSRLAITLSTKKHSHSHQESTFAADQELPESGYLKVTNSGEGFESVGWRFSPEKVFNRAALYSWISGIEAERLKAVFITNEGVFGYNLTSDALTEVALSDCLESKIEILYRQGSPAVDFNPLEFEHNNVPIC